VSPAQAASLRAEPNRLASPISARMTSAVRSPTPGSLGEHRDPWIDPWIGLGVLAHP
jgi:hypothetical protein